MIQYECEDSDKEIPGDCKSLHSGDMGHKSYTYSRDLDYQGVTQSMVDLTQNWMETNKCSINICNCDIMFGRLLGDKSHPQQVRQSGILVFLFILAAIHNTHYESMSFVNLITFLMCKFFQIEIVFSFIQSLFIIKVLVLADI